MLISFVNQKGGVGKSTLLLCVAGELMRRGSKVLIVELDGQKTCGDFVKVGHHRKKATPSHVAPEGAWRKTVAEIADNFGYVLVDTPGHMAEGSSAKRYVEEALAVSDLAVIPLSPCQADLSAASDTLVLARRASLKNPHLHIQTVVNNAAPNTRLSGEIIEALTDSGYPPTRTMVGLRPNAYRALHSLGETPSVTDPKSKAGEEIRLLTDELLDVVNPKLAAVGS